VLGKKILILCFFSFIADRLKNIEEALNNLISCVNTLGEDVASIVLQLKPLSKNVKYIQNVSMNRVHTSGCLLL
jgi:hypothetical protein